MLRRCGGAIIGVGDGEFDDWVAGQGWVGEHGVEGTVVVGGGGSDGGTG